MKRREFIAEAAGLFTALTTADEPSPASRLPAQKRLESNAGPENRRDPMRQMSTDERPKEPSRSGVDFSYAFGTPHRLTVARPDSSDKTLLDLQPGYLRMAWTYENLRRFPLAAFKTPRTDWDIHVYPEVDGKPCAKSAWTRLDGYLPMLDNVYVDGSVRVELRVAGAATAALIHVEIANASDLPRRVTLRCESMNCGENPAWVDATRWVGDNLVAGWNERADRVLMLGIGADAYSLSEDRRPPGPKELVCVWDVKPGETRTGWLVRPYRAYAADLQALRKGDWAKELDAAKKEWRTLLGRASRVTIPDPGVENAFLACLADLFIMREPVAEGYLGTDPGTEGYRAPNAFEAGIVAVALNQLGYTQEAAIGYKMCIDMQEHDGNWDDPKGWGHLMWGGAGFKAWAAIEHYRITHNREYLAALYPRLVANSRWQEKERKCTRVSRDGERPLSYGLMPRGMGDCGLMNDNDLYGVFLPHNIWAVYADACSVEAAEILGRTADLPEIRQIYQTAREDLVQALERGSIPEGDYRWIPGVPCKTSSSLWGVLNALFPCGILPADHPLITGAIRHMESHLSPGGLPVHLGWMKDGLWVAIALDNLAEAHLVRGDGDAAARYLYAALNHGTPLYTWCEERGQEPGAEECTGDRQHLFTPVAVVRAIRDSFVMEKGNMLHLALGTAREWLAGGIGIADARTHFGCVSYSMRYDPAASLVKGDLTFPTDTPVPSATLHVRLPGDLRVQSVDPASGASVLPDGSGLVWQLPRGKRRFEAVIGHQTSDATDR